MTRPRSNPTPQPRPAAAPPVASTPAPHPHRVRAACGLAMLCFAIYLSNLHPMGAWDSIPARLLPFSILREGNLDLDEFTWLRSLNPEPYFLVHGRNGHWWSRYPVVLPIVVTPVFAPAVWWLDAHHIDQNDVRFRLASVVMERVAAALIASISVALVFLCLSSLTAPAMAAGIALVYAFGTSTWTIGSQALWQHGLAELALAGLSLCLLGPDTRRRAAAAGALAALTVLARPTMAVFALLALAFMWRERRAHLAAFMSFPLLGLTFLLVYNRHFGNFLRGGYMFGYLVVPSAERLAGLLVSPNRGLLIYTPAAVLALGALLPEFRRSRWLTYLLIGIGCYLLLYTAWFGWWGGQAYGPRFLTDALPAMALCAAPLGERLWRRWSGRVGVGLLVGWGVFVQGVGVYCDSHAWDQAGNVRTRLWDWSDIQIARTLHSGWRGTDLAPLLWQALTDPRPTRLQHLTGAQLKGKITVTEASPLHLRGGDIASIGVRITNQSDAAWPAYSDYGYLQCKLTYSWWAGSTPLPQAGGISLPRNLPPGESATVRARVEVPAHPGTYDLELMLVQVLELDRGTSGGTVLRVPVVVE